MSKSRSSRENRRGKLSGSLVIGILALTLVCVGYFVTMISKDSIKEDLDSSRDTSASSSISGTLTIDIYDDIDGGAPLESHLVDCSESTFCKDFLDENLSRGVPPMAQCTMIYGGPGSLTVSGEIRRTDTATPINSSFNFSNGCEIERSESLYLLFKKNDLQIARPSFR